MGFFKKDELKLLWPFYLSLIFVVFIILPIFQIPYFLQIGLSLTQIGLIISATALAVFLFEIPTGAIADIFGRKFSVIFGIFLTGIIITLVYFIKNFYGLLIIFFLWGLFATFSSGASDAWVIDLLKHNKRKELVQEYYSKVTSFSAAGFCIAGFLGAFLVKKFGMEIIWPLSGIALILSAIILMFGKEHFIKKEAHITKKIREIFTHTKRAIKYSVHHQAISLILIISIISMLTIGLSGNIVWFSLLQDFNFKDYWFGYLASITALLGIFVPLLTPFLLNKFKSQKKFLITIYSLFIMLFLAVYFVKGWEFAAALVILTSILGVFTGIVRQTFFQKFIPSKMRATITSFREMIMAFIVIFSVPLGSWIAEIIGKQYSIMLSGLLTIPVIILYSKIKE